MRPIASRSPSRSRNRPRLHSRRPLPRSNPPAIEAPAFIRDSEALGRAFELASRSHSGQRGRDGRPYLAHPLAVCELLHDRGAGEAVLAGALLHDAVEDSDLRVGEVVDDFGAEIGELVAALTEDERIGDWVERKDALRAQVAAARPSAVSIYAADKLANLREMREIYSTRGESAIDLHKAPTLDLKVDAWHADVEMVERSGASSEIAAELRRELEKLERDRAARPTVGARND